MLGTVGIMQDAATGVACGVKIVNCTPHAIHIAGWDSGVITLSDGTVAKIAATATIEPSGMIARVATKTEPVATITVDGVTFPVVETAFGAVEGLPDAAPGTVYVVSRLVLQALPGRDDLLAPGEPIRDANGAIIGCRGLSR